MILQLSEESKATISEIFSGLRKYEAMQSVNASQIKTEINEFISGKLFLLNSDLVNIEDGILHFKESAKGILSAVLRDTAFRFAGLVVDFAIKETGKDYTRGSYIEKYNLEYSTDFAAIMERNSLDYVFIDDTVHGIRYPLIIKVVGEEYGITTVATCQISKA